MELALGLMTEAEMKELTERKMTYSLDGKTDRYPTRNRPAAIFYKFGREVTELWRQGYISSPNHHLSIENEIKNMAKVRGRRSRAPEHDCGVMGMRSPRDRRVAAVWSPCDRHVMATCVRPIALFGRCARRWST